MGWIITQNIEFYSIADTIEQMTSLLFNLILSLSIPQVVFATILFFLTIMIYMFTAIKIKIEKSLG